VQTAVNLLRVRCQHVVEVMSDLENFVKNTTLALAPATHSSFSPHTPCERMSAPPLEGNCSKAQAADHVAAVKALAKYDVTTDEFMN
jgi:hypothetical protein